MKRNFFLILIVMLLQSCFAHITQDYGGLSRALVFNDGKKYLINDIYTDLGSTQRERLNKKVLETFQKLSGGNAVSYSVAKSAHLVPGRIAIKPDAEDLLELKDNSDFGYLVNIYTKKVRSDLAPVETGDIYQSVKMRLSPFWKFTTCPPRKKFTRRKLPQKWRRKKLQATIFSAITESGNQKARNFTIRRKLFLKRASKRFFRTLIKTPSAKHQ